MPDSFPGHPRQDKVDDEPFPGHPCICPKYHVRSEFHILQAQRCNHLLESGAIGLNQMDLWYLQACEALRAEKANAMFKARKA